MKSKQNTEIVKKKEQSLVVQDIKQELRPDYLKAKINEAKTWVLENPIQATGLTLMSLLFLRTRLTRKALYWAITTVASSELISLLNQNFKDEVLKNSSHLKSEKLH